MRLDINTYHEIMESLLRNKSRSLLTGFGIFWGLFMLLVMLGAGDGVKGLLSSNFDGFASNAAVMVSSNTSVPYKGFQEGRYWTLKPRDVERIKMLIPEAEVVTPMYDRWGEKAVYNSQTTSCSVSGVNADYTAIEAPRMKYGRYLNEVDVERGRKVCVIGKRIYNELFPEGGDPCGTFIQVGSVFFQIVGVNFSSGNISINGNTTTKVVIPSTVARQLYNLEIDILCMTARSGFKMTELEPRVRQVLAREHLFDPTDEPALMFINTEQIFNLIDTLFRGVDFLILLIGLGTLLAGAIGVSNIMMVTVKERTVEIGIRRAIGATPRDILSQIMLESVSLTLVAGMFGIVFSVMSLSLAEIIVANSNMGDLHPAFQISFGLAVAAAALLAVLGLAAGLAPALRAMNIKPVDAMRDE